MSPESHFHFDGYGMLYIDLIDYGENKLPRLRLDFVEVGMREGTLTIPVERVKEFTDCLLKAAGIK